MREVPLLALTLVSTGSPPDTFDVHAELQGLYDEISQATREFVTESDVDLFHDVLYTPDCVFVDARGRRQTWSEWRQRAVDALSAPPPDSIAQSICRLSPASDGVTVIVNMTTVRTIVDQAGRYGREGASHKQAVTTAFRDGWVRVSEDWKLKSREQISEPTVSVADLIKARREK
jgi:hypothetical protein